MDYVYGAGEYAYSAVSGALNYVWSSSEEKFDVSKLNRQLTTCLIRMNQYKNKKSNELKIERLNIAKFLRENNPEAVRIKVERIIRDEYLLEALDLMVPLIEVLQSRRFMLEQMTNCPFDTLESVTTIIFASKYVEVEEFQQMRRQFELKYGRSFVEKALIDEERSVNEKVKFKLTIGKPEPNLVVQYIRELAEKHNIEIDDVPIQPKPSAPELYPKLIMHEVPECTPSIYPMQPIYYGEPIILPPQPSYNIQEPQYILPNDSQISNSHQPPTIIQYDLPPYEEQPDLNADYQKKEIINELERRLAQVKLSPSNSKQETKSSLQQVEQSIDLSPPIVEEDWNEDNGDIVDQQKTQNVIEKVAPKNDDEQDLSEPRFDKPQDRYNLDTLISAQEYNHSDVFEQVNEPVVQTYNDDQMHAMSSDFDDLVEHMSSVATPVEEHKRQQYQVNTEDETTLFDRLQQQQQHASEFVEQPSYEDLAPKQNINSLFDSLLSRHIDE